MLQRHSQCVSELCELSQSSTSPAVLIRLTQYYASWAQLRDTLMPEWIPQGMPAFLCVCESERQNLLKTVRKCVVRMRHGCKSHVLSVH